MLGALALNVGLYFFSLPHVTMYGLLSHHVPHISYKLHDAPPN